ncbi:MAG: glycoside hydrolase family 2 protein [Spirosomataceae bacterium]
MYKNRLFLTLTVITGLLHSLTTNAQESQKIYLSGTDKDHTIQWDFFCTKGMNSGKWSKIAVPSNWELQGFGKYSYGIENRKAETRSDEQGLYKTTFVLPKLDKTKQVTIVFEGSMTDTEVKINGSLAGPIHQGGFYEFQYDITSLLKQGKNTLEVTVSKASSNKSVEVAERHGDFWALGGIHRPVYLSISPSTSIERIALDAKANGKMLIEAFTNKADENYTLEAQVQSLDGKTVGSAFSSKVTAGSSKTILQQAFQHVQLWNAETPNLYQVTVSLKDNSGKNVHSITERFGFRTVEIRKRDGVYINGNKIVLKGTNRHTFYPESGRTTSKALSILDAQLMKEMNMNAVRMSHYPPEKHFLEVCDSLGLYVLDEVTGWQNRYDTEAGRKLVRETVIRDVNHPSVIWWDNGNEGGWNRELDGDFAPLDPQKRIVFHPWERYNLFDSKHYITYNYLTTSALYDTDILFPTEFMHGLFDGGQGAGLDDFWNAMMQHPYCAGGMLWAYADEGIIRTDKNGEMDCSGNNAPDGIVGPHREKEGSFYTVKEIWSPIVITQKYLPKSFGGILDIENRYSFINLNECSLEWKLVDFPNAKANKTEAIIRQTGKPLALALEAGAKGKLNLQLPSNWLENDALYLTARDPKGNEIYTWTWAIRSPEEIENRLPSVINTVSFSSDADSNVVVKSGNTSFYFQAKTGFLSKVNNGKNDISFSKGPSLIGVKTSLKSWSVKQEGSSVSINARYEGENCFLAVSWLFAANQLPKLSYQYHQKGDYELLGIGFDYPESNVTGVTYLGRGPYRVWKNRLKGQALGVWYKAYNDAITGESWNYPEFKGYHAQMQWATLENSEGNFTVYSGNENTFLQLLKPSSPKAASNNNTSPLFPEGNIGFLQAISPIGAKFNSAELFGPQSQKMNTMRNYTPYTGTLWFDFN